MCPRGGARNLTPAVALCILAGGAWTLGDSLRSQAGRATKASEPRKLQRRSPDIEPEKGAEEVEFEAFDPADRHTDVSGERDVDTRAGRGDPDPPAVVGKVLADRRRRQRGREFWNGVERGLRERVRVGPWPSAVVPVGWKFVVFDDVTDLRNERVGTSPFTATTVSGKAPNYRPSGAKPLLRVGSPHAV
jgi:hypothetical protein